MSRRRPGLQLLDAYEVIGEPVVTADRLSYVPWVERAVSPYNATRLPHCTILGLWDALQRHQGGPDAPAPAGTA